MGKQKILRLCAVSGILGLVAACSSPPPEPPPLTPTPSYNKMGALVDCGPGFAVAGDECVPLDPPPSM